MGVNELIEEGAAYNEMSVGLFVFCLIAIGIMFLSNNNKVKLIAGLAGGIALLPYALEKCDGNIMIFISIMCVITAGVMFYHAKFKAAVIWGIIGFLLYSSCGVI